MATKSDILNNLREYTADQIVEAIKAGTVTVYELSKSGNLTPLMRRRIEERLAAKTTEATPSAPEVAPTVEDAPTLNLDEDPSDDIEIPKAIDTDIPSEITIPEASIVTATDTPTVEPAKKKVSSTSNTPSNKGMFKRPFSFNGRIRRTEYCLSFLIYMIWYGVINAMMATPDPSAGASLFVLISFISMIWFIWAQNAKRCHDRGNSGWYQLIPFYVFVLMFGGSDEGSNEYGNNPKE